MTLEHAYIARKLHIIPTMSSDLDILLDFRALITQLHLTKGDGNPLVGKAA